MFIVFDLDDTLSDPAHRLHHICTPEAMHDAPDWDSFFAARADDEPIWPILFLFHALHKHGLHRVEVWTASREDHRVLTEEWLHAHGVPKTCLTNMRSVGDMRPAVELKREWVLADKPDLAFDDHVGIVKMMRELGVHTVLVGENDY